MVDKLIYYINESIFYNESMIHYISSNVNLTKKCGVKQSLYENVIITLSMEP